MTIDSDARPQVDPQDQEPQGSDSFAQPKVEPNVSDAIAQTKAAAENLVSDGGKLATNVLSDTRKSAEGAISQQKERAAASLGGVATALRQTGEHMQASESPLTNYVVQAAARVDAAAGYLKEKSLSELFEEVGSYAKREPALFIGGAFALGVFGGRFLKSSQQTSAPKASSGAASFADENGSAQFGIQGETDIHSPRGARGRGRAQSSGKKRPGAS